MRSSINKIAKKRPTSEKLLKFLVKAKSQSWTELKNENEKLRDENVLLAKKLKAFEKSS